MNVSLQNIDNVSALLTVDMVRADYLENVEKSLKKIRKDAQMPGFRKGMVPMALVKKMYEKSVIVDEVNKMLGEAINKYIEDNKVEILGEPLPDESQEQIDFDTMDEYKFLFDLALAPKFDVEMSEADKVDYYDVVVTDEMVDNQSKMYAQRNGKYETADEYAEDDDMLRGTLTQLDENGSPLADGIKVEDTPMMPNYMKNEEQKAKFKGAKKDSTVVFNPAAAWDNNAAEIASMLKVDKEVAETVKSDFSYEIKEITRFVPGELDQTIFDQVFGEGVVKSVEEFKEKVKDTIAGQFAANSDFRFLTDARKVLMDKVGKLEFSEKLLKRIMKLNNPDKDDKFIDENYDKSIEELSWQLMRNKLIEKFGIKVEQNEIVDAARAATRAQFAQYGMLNVPEQAIDNYVNEMFKRREALDNLAGRVIDNKLTEEIKGKVTLNHKSVSTEEFNKLFE